MTTEGEREWSASGVRFDPAEHVEPAHGALRDRMEAVAGATTQDVLVRVMAPLPEMLREHFAREEHVDGFYDDLQRRLPSRAPELDVLRSEHGEILEACEALSRQLKERMNAEPTAGEIRDDTQKDVASLLDRIRSHEHRESVLIGDAYYTDEGGRG
jgi:hypothetical protein